MRLTTIIGLCILILFFIVSCNDREANQNQIVTEDNDTVEVIFGDQQISLTANNYKDLTEEAIELYEEETSLFKPNRTEIQKWFIRYYIQMHEYNENVTNEELFQLAEERYEYEEAWKEYASEAYSVTVSDEAVESQANYNLDIYTSNLPPSIKGMSSGLDLSVEEFMVEFDRDHVERSVIWQQLMPKLLEKHQSEEAQTLDGVYLGQLYEEEVLEYLEENT
ncbi:hypothetical protein CR194_11390 [Salipaludibacillus keqinensis]|uniref:Uncharacterized protein n=1 Tax=Salipaludibacillus keqinensis TaxID=2045207 RepID=A0A323TH01_9BACI|nr:hypothetical protein [Salipaludibacillus keqinensis]PYZ93750.1 hypothetical protein CR194_11390 [Salipaludibacillus keqinensis]